MSNKLYIGLDMIACIDAAKRMYCDMGMMEARWWWDFKIVCLLISTGILLSSLYDSQYKFSIKIYNMLKLQVPAYYVLSSLCSQQSIPGS